MRSYLNGGGLAQTPPPGAGLGRGAGHRGGPGTAASLPRSPDHEGSLASSAAADRQLTSGSGQSGHGSLGSHSSHEVAYMNIYQNTNHHNIYVSTIQQYKVSVPITLQPLFQDTNHHGHGLHSAGSPRHSLGSNNSSNLSTPPSPARELGSSSYSS